MDYKKLKKELDLLTQDQPRNVSNIKVNTTVTPLDEFLMDYYHCSLCGTELEYAHVTHFVNNEVEENAHCPSCGIHHNKGKHILQ